MPRGEGIGQLTDRGAVLKAVAECDRLGRDAFLAKYGFGRARAYVLHHEGREYDSKAIAGRAYGIQHGGKRLMSFAGGAQTVWPVLTRLGFRVDGVELDDVPEAQPTADPDLLAERIEALRKRRNGRPPAKPAGNAKPPKVAVAGGFAFVRDPHVGDFTLERAGGVCESCDADAPFTKRNGTPYLEVHHIVMLADGGADTTDNTAAVCPNCHRALHCASDRKQRAAKLAARRSPQ